MEFRAVDVKAVYK